MSSWYALQLHTDSLRAITIILSQGNLPPSLGLSEAGGFGLGVLPTGSAKKVQQWCPGAISKVK